MSDKFDLHAKKIYGYAFWDLFLTVIGAIILFRKDWLMGFIILFIIGQLLHMAFKVDTHFIKQIKQIKQYIQTNQAMLCKK